MPRVTPSIRATVCSATDSSSVPGVIVTAMPRSVAAGDIDRVVAHAHPGDRPQLRRRQHLARQRLDAGQHRIDAVQQRQQVLPLHRVAALRRIDHLKPALQQRVASTAREYCEESSA